MPRPKKLLLIATSTTFILLLYQITVLFTLKFILDHKLEDQSVFNVESTKLLPLQRQINVNLSILGQAQQIQIKPNWLGNKIRATINQPAIKAPPLPIKINWLKAPHRISADKIELSAHLALLPILSQDPDYKNWLKSITLQLTNFHSASKPKTKKPSDIHISDLYATVKPQSLSYSIQAGPFEIKNMIKADKIKAKGNLDELSQLDIKNCSMTPAFIYSGHFHYPGLNQLIPELMPFDATASSKNQQTKIDAFTPSIHVKSKTQLNISEDEVSTKGDITLKVTDTTQFNQKIIPKLQGPLLKPLTPLATDMKKIQVVLDTKESSKKKKSSGKLTLYVTDTSNKTITDSLSYESSRRLTLAQSITINDHRFVIPSPPLPYQFNANIQNPKTLEAIQIIAAPTPFHIHLQNQKTPLTLQLEPAHVPLF